MPETDFAPVPQTYDAFIKDLKAGGHEVRPDEQIRDLIKTTRDENLSEEQRQRARNEIIEANLRAIPYVIKGLPNTGVPPEELIGQGFEVLNSCIDNFDADHVSPKTEDTVKFSSYLISSLEANFKSPRTVEGVGKKIVLPVYVEEYASLMRKIREDFVQKHYREPSPDEWYKTTVDFLGKNRRNEALKGFTLEAFEGARAHGIEKKYIPIGERTGRGNVHSDTLSTASGNIEDIVADPDVNVEEEVTKSVLKDDMEDLMANLKSSERTVLQLRYGIGLNEEGKPKKALSQDEVAKIIGVSRNKVGYIERAGLRKLRHPSRSRKIRDYVESSPDINKLSKEEAEYEKVIRTGVNELTSRAARNNADMASILTEMKRGLKSTGKLDPELLQEIFGDRYTTLLIRESQLKSSPRSVVRDLMTEINRITDPYWRKRLGIDSLNPDEK